ncbi:DUF1697 domain-containing protein [Nocardioides pakistanensis]
MPSYVAFLRAINLGRTRKFPMAELRSCVEAAGFRDVETYIQTGNLRVSTSMRSADRVAALLEEVFEADRGFAVPTVVLTPDELRQVHDDAHSLEPLVEGDVRRYVTFLRSPAPPDVAAEIAAIEAEGEAARAIGRAVHVWVRDGYQSARINNARIERRLGVATTRDLKVVTTLTQRWGG